MRVLIAIAAVATAVSACASGSGTGGYDSELQRLSDSCRARGGVLTPSTGPLTGRPELDNICRISGSVIQPPRPTGAG